MFGVVRFVHEMIDIFIINLKDMTTAKHERTGLAQ
jgi:hypothetical protein